MHGNLERWKVCIRNCWGAGERDARVGVYQSLREEYALDVSATQVGGYAVDVGEANDVATGE